MQPIRLRKAEGVGPMVNTGRPGQPRTGAGNPTRQPRPRSSERPQSPSGLIRAPIATNNRRPATAPRHTVPSRPGTPNRPTSKTAAKRPARPQSGRPKTSSDRKAKPEEAVNGLLRELEQFMELPPSQQPPAEDDLLDELLQSQQKTAEPSAKPQADAGQRTPIEAAPLEPTPAQSGRPAVFRAASPSAIASRVVPSHEAEMPVPDKSTGDPRPAPKPSPQDRPSALPIIGNEKASAVAGPNRPSSTKQPAPFQPQRGGSSPVPAVPSGPSKPTKVGSFSFGSPTAVKAEDEFEVYDENGNGLLEMDEVLRMCQDQLYFFPSESQLTRTYKHLCTQLGARDGNGLTHDVWASKNGLRVLRHQAAETISKEKPVCGGRTTHFWHGVLQWLPDLETLLLCGWVCQDLRSISATDAYWLPLLRRERRRQQLRAPQAWDMPAINVKVELRTWFLMWKKSVWMDKGLKEQAQNYAREVAGYSSHLLTHKCEWLACPVVCLDGATQRAMVAIGDERGVLQYRDPRKDADNNEVLTGEHDGAITCITESATYLLTGSADAACYMWLKSSLGFPAIALQGHSEAITAIAISADEKFVVTGSLDRTLILWDRTRAVRAERLATASTPEDGDRANYCTVKATATMRGHSMKVTVVVLTETWIISASTDSQIRIWDYQGKCVTQISGHNGPVNHIHLIGDTLWSFCGAGLMRTTSVAHPTVFESTRIHKFPISCVHFAGPHFFVGGNDGLVAAFEVESRTQIALLEGHETLVRCILLLPNTSRLVTACDDKSVRVWDVGPLASQTPDAPLLHVFPHFFLGGPNAAILAIVPFVAEDGLLWGVLGSGVDRRLHCWRFKSAALK
eukprot:GGOE01005861.1.p1 GENE.GGOE01005861.1~~GGOE01005861.1.p1  ORF type:complete len:851 (-),score=172.77 GGOE01005861.1:29-2581(-)